MLKTIVYIDGFNFYYGSLKHTPYKWIDLQRLFESLLCKNNEVVKVKYFTARIRPSKKNAARQWRQDAYLKALSVYCPKVEIIYGHYSRHKVVVSNDSDLSEALRMVKKRNKAIGLVTPGAPKRLTSRQLSESADFIRTIRPTLLGNSCLPDPVPGTRIHKPSVW